MAKRKPTRAKAPPSVTEEVAAIEEAETVLAEDTTWEPPAPFDREKMLSSGVKSLNLVISLDHRYAFPQGKYVRYYGASGTAKTDLMLRALAEAARNPVYDGHDLIYIDKEIGALFDPRRYGKKLFDRLEWVRDSATSEGPPHLEGMYLYLLRRMKEKPIVAVVDSLDAFMTAAQLKNMKARQTATSETKLAAIKDPYGGGKAAVNSDYQKALLGPMESTGSIVFFISQERDDPNAMFESAKPSGGRSTTFYASVELHMYRGAAIKKSMPGASDEDSGVPVGANMRIVVDKNRVRGCPRRSAKYLFYDASGVDNVGTAVDWLIENKVFSTAGAYVTAPGIASKGMYKEKLIQGIQSRPELRERLFDIMQEEFVKQDEILRNLVYRVPEYD